MESPLRIPDDPDFRLIETALWTPGGGLHNGARHLARLARTADALGITPIGVDRAVAEITAAGPRRVRLTVAACGQVNVALHPFTPLAEDTTWRLCLSETRLTSNAPWLRLKTTQRALYDCARAGLPDTVDEQIFLNERGEVCEGTITNIFADLGQGLVTPPVSSGLLPGILREVLLAEGRVHEQVLTVDDLQNANAIYVGNSLRGLISAALGFPHVQTANPTANP